MDSVYNLLETFTDEEDSDSEMEEYTDQFYATLKTGKPKVKLSSERFVCPGCKGKKINIYKYKDLLQHAKGVGLSTRRNSKERGNHLALVKYLEQDLAEGEPSSKRRKTEHGSVGIKIEEDTIDHNEKLVCPWKGIVVNIPTTKEKFRTVGESGSNLRDEFTERGFNPIRVRPLWNYQGHSGTGIVEFNRDESGLNNARIFDKAYRLDGKGKEDWLAKDGPKSGLYAWMACADDYTRKGIIGEQLRKTSNLKTIAEVGF